MEDEEEKKRENPEVATTRQNAFVIFSQDKDVRTAEIVKNKVAAYTGVAMRMKAISQSAMENLLQGIYLDAQNAKS